MDNGRKTVGGSEVLAGVGCEVTKCVYNEQMHCSADEILVAPSYAGNSTGSSSETLCATFRAR